MRISKCVSSEKGSQCNRKPNQNKNKTILVSHLVTGKQKLDCKTPFASLIGGGTRIKISLSIIQEYYFIDR